ncbi:MAG TPA: extracellular solute-binding protein, partial [Candidatus Binatia bacterium]|nr:extracellular solute-binding protein [Candidatus Binatia bacterium]
KLVEAAKKEGGKVVVYGSIENDTMDLISAAFKKKTGLDVDFWRSSATKVMDRVVSESRAGKPLYDVALTNSAPMDFMYNEGALTKYDSPSAKAFPKSVMHPHLGPQYRNSIIGIVYHSGIVKPADAPKSLEDLLKPQYRGKVVMPDASQHTTTAQWLASLHKVMGGREKADKFIRDLAATKPLLVESLTPAGERITTGETPIGIAFIKNVVFYGKKGVPLDYVRLDKFMGDGQAVALGAKAPHPNAGKAFMDFFLGEEGLKIMAGIGEFVTRKGIYPPLPDADKIELVEMVDMDKKAYADKMAEYRKIFLQ